MTTTTPDENVNHPIFARWYARASEAMERGGFAGYRRTLLADLSGQVVELGAGNGLNFAHYPSQVTRLLAVEPDPYLRRLAQARAAEAPIPVRVVEGLAGRLPAEDREFDAAVVSLVLCSVTDQRQALAELHRVLRDGGQLRFLEHVRSTSPALARVQRFLDAGLWPSLGGGCHTGRDTTGAIQGAGFTIESIDRFDFPESRIRLPASPHVIGRAKRRGEGQPTNSSAP